MVKATVSTALLAMVSVTIGCVGEGVEEGVLTDSCTGEIVGQVADDGSLYLDDGRVVEAPTIEWLDSGEIAAPACEENGVDGVLRDALDRGEYLMLDYIACGNRGCCGFVVIVWCWNGDCSSEGAAYCD